ncbi:Chromatin-remodeling ATPase INO80 [Astathelohania contejeani]|uniref:Chromatin-remodeling ATPase INO80 n=1 Tax=Astathelohania contejeani TaxID=164912 RepID=A0ABQ7HWK4_9MICR|nr:Chromatin-remodeling ATPase INO80 [Thelohania contejeani]
MSDDPFKSENDASMDVKTSTAIIQAMMGDTTKCFERVIDCYDVFYEPLGDKYFRLYNEACNSVLKTNDTFLDSISVDNHNWRIFPDVRCGTISFAYQIESEIRHLGEAAADARCEEEIIKHRNQAWRYLSRTQVSRTHRAILNMNACIQNNQRKLATICAREIRRALCKTSRTNPILKGRRLAKELGATARREKDTKEYKRKADREALEKRRREDEEREAARQARKLNFLLNQTELFSHFILNKKKEPQCAEEARALTAVNKQLEKTQEFDEGRVQKNESRNVDQPSILTCTLKEYQLRGLNWLVSLYSQGINGILADDMGLGKTVQAISLLAYLAESENIWGPFLVVTPASTLHNWVQEFEKFLPSFKIVPYWGNISERKILKKKFTGRFELTNRESQCHVVITSYQMVVTDEKIFQKVRWEYMILDEAQAIKSSLSQRWRALLGFKCRSRLLLTGTPIQNNMQELWALLHFIMPTLFDSHDEFNDWFSKDIEGSSKVDEVQLQRLHLILKPFMLRREKSDVRNELGTKTEIDIICTLSHRQRVLYEAIRRKTPMAELLESRSIGEIEETDTLMNVVMQFRKVCNHPNLFEKLEPESGLCFEMNDHFRKDYIGFPERSKIGVRIPRIVGDFIGESLRKRMRKCFNKINTIDKLISGISGNNNIIDPIINYPSSVRTMYNYRVISSLPSIITDSNQYPLMHHISNLERSLLYNRINGRDSLSYRYISPSNYSLFLNHRPRLPIIGPDRVFVPRLDRFISDSGKLLVLDSMLPRLKEEGRRILMYFQMTRMIDLMEDYLIKKHYSYLRLDGSSKISARRDMVRDWQTNDDKFIFLLSTRAGGLGINLTAADTVIFYDSDWNPTVDQQAMDRAHRLGQTKDVTVYRLITKDTIEERVMERAQRKGEIQKMVIQGGSFKGIE